MNPRNFFKRYAEIMRPVARATGWWLHHVPKRARAVDEARRAKRVLTPWDPRNIQRWKKYHNRYDLVGVDDPVTNPRRIIRLTLEQERRGRWVYKFYEKVFRVDADKIIQQLGLGNIVFHNEFKEAKLLFRGIEDKIEPVVEQLKRGFLGGGGAYSRKVVSTTIWPRVAWRFGENVYVIDKKVLERLGAEFWPLTYVLPGEGSSEDGEKYGVSFSDELEVRVKKNIPGQAVGAVYTPHGELLDKIKEEGLRLIPLPLRLLERLLNR